MKEFVEKTAEEFDALTAKEQAEYLQAKKKHDTETRQKEITEAIEKAKKDITDENRVETEKHVAKLEATVKILTEEMEAFGVKMKGITENPVFVGKDRSMTPIKAILEGNKERIKALKSNGGKFEVEMNLETKAAHNPTDIADRDQLGQWEPGVSQIPYQNLYMQNMFVQGNATTEYIKYVQQATIVRDAKNVAACATTTHNSKVTWDIQDLQMKKTRDFTNVCLDMMEDYDFVEGEIRDLVQRDVQLKVDADLLLGDGIGVNLNGVASYASTFNAANPDADYSGKVGDATVIDLIVVGGAQIKAFGAQNFFRPNVVMMNPTDVTLMGLMKDGMKNYIKMGSVNAAIFRDVNGTLYINGMMVMENPNVPENEMYIFDSRRGKYFRRKGVVVEFSYENGTNFENEMVTVKAYERSNLLVKNNDANAFLHIPDIAASVAAITAS